MSVPFTVEGFTDLELIGTGGFSHVYKALDTGFQSHVALKVLNITLDDRKDRSAFEHECHVLGRLRSHPDIVTPLRNGFTSSGLPFIAMELMDCSLWEFIRKHGPLSVPEMLHTILKVAGALGAAHAAGILHRDVKPQNVLLSLEYRHPKLADFGIATVQTSANTMGLSPITPPYAAPEIHEGEPASQQSDLYSLAATGFAFLTGSPPVPPRPDESQLAYARRIVTEPPSPLPAGTPGPVSGPLLGAIAKRPEERTRTVRDFAAQLLEAQRVLGYQQTEIHVGTPAPSDPQPATGGTADARTVSRERARMAASPPGSARETPFAGQAPSAVVTATVARQRSRVEGLDRIELHEGEGAGRRGWLWIAGGAAILTLATVFVVLAFVGGDGGPARTDGTEQDSDSSGGVPLSPATVDAIRPLSSGGFAFTWSDPNPDSTGRLAAYQVFVDGEPASEALVEFDVDVDGLAVTEQIVETFVDKSGGTVSVDTSIHEYCVVVRLVPADGGDVVDSEARCTGEIAP